MGQHVTLSPRCSEKQELRIRDDCACHGVGVGKAAWCEFAVSISLLPSKSPSFLGVPAHASGYRLPAPKLLVARLYRKVAGLPFTNMRN
jgi:hypothetical protein